ncbi:phage head completion protein [Shewanella baltica]|uniref:phage head completion protein n=1 Tax=Shewanella baltica TaxID=62322 RepID=UPI003D79A9C8
MQAGKLNKRVAHYQAVAGKSLNGAPIKLLTRLRFTWTKIEQVGASASDAGERTQAINRYQVTLRHRNGVTVKIDDWLQYKISWLKVVGVDGLIDDGKALVLTCESNPNEPPPEVQ